jgi:hypothetical protein
MHPESEEYQPRVKDQEIADFLSEVIEELIPSDQNHLELAYKTLNGMMPTAEVGVKSLELYASARLMKRIMAAFIISNAMDMLASSFNVGVIVEGENTRDRIKAFLECWMVAREKRQYAIKREELKRIFKLDNEN